LSSVHSALYSIPAAVDRLFQHRVVQFEETQVVVAADVDERTKAERKEHGDGEFLHQFMFQRLLEDLAAQVLFLAEQLVLAKLRPVRGVVELLQEPELDRSSD